MTPRPRPTEAPPFGRIFDRQAVSTGPQNGLCCGAVMTPTLRLSRRAFAATFWCLAAFAPAGAQDRAAPSTAAPPARIEAVTAHNGMVGAQEKRARRIGGEILEKGGHAVD